MLIVPPPKDKAEAMAVARANRLMPYDKAPDNRHGWYAEGPLGVAIFLPMVFQVSHLL